MSSQSHSAVCETLEPRRLLSASYDWGLGGGSSGKAEVTATASDTDGSVYVVGRFSGTIDVDPSTDEHPLTALGDSDMFIAGYSASGELLWAKTNGGADGRIYPSAIALFPSVPVAPVVVGSFTGTVELGFDGRRSVVTSNGGEDAFYMTVPHGFHKTFGGPYYDAIRTVDTSLGNLLIGGVFSKTVRFPWTDDPVTSVGRQDGFVGTCWSDLGFQASYFTIGGTGYDVVNEIHVKLPAVGTATFELSVVGTMEGTVSFGPSAVADPNGEFSPVYSTSQGGTDAYFAQYFSSWSFASQGYVYRNVYAETFGSAGDDWGDAMAVGPSGAYVAGTFVQPMNGLTSNGGSDIFVKKIGGAVHQIGSTGDDAMGRLALGDDGRLIVTGRYTAPIAFNEVTLPHAGMAGKSDIFMATYDDTFAARTVVGFGGPYRDTVTALATASGGVVYLGGWFQGRMNLGVGDVTAIMFGSIDGDFYLDRLIIQ